MKYVIKAELDLNLGNSCLFPGLCDFHAEAILTDKSMALLTGQSDSPHGFQISIPWNPFSATTQLN